MMKKYATHRVYDAPNHYYNQSMVTIDSNGVVVDCSPLTHESPATEWIGGIIILSARTEITPSGNFHDFLQAITGEEKPLYAWHITNFDFQEEKLTPGSLINRL